MSNFIDNNNGTISDNSNGLLWMKYTFGKNPDGSGESQKLIWSDALLESQKFNFLNKTWRLPTIRELTSIIDYDKNNPAIYDSFQSECDGYWTSTVPSDQAVWIVYFSYGISLFNYKNFEYYVKYVTNI